MTKIAGVILFITVFLVSSLNAGVTQDANGWTVVTPSADSRIIYVSQSDPIGCRSYLPSDSEVGSDPFHPQSVTTCRTISEAKELMRHNFPDWILIKRGDEFYETIGKWRTSGRSLQEPTVISSYGDGERPLLKTGTSSGWYTSGSGNAPAIISYVFLSGIDFYAHHRDPNTPEFVSTDGEDAGIRSRMPGEMFWVEDVSVKWYAGGVVITSKDGSLQNFQLRRSVVTNSYVTKGHSQGTFYGGIDGILIEENLFDHNGWYLDRNAPSSGGGATTFNHNIYIDNENPTNPTTRNEIGHILVRGNIVTRGSSHGIQARAGGTVEDNLFIQNAINLLIGGGDGHETTTPDGVDGIAKDNVILDPSDISDSIDRGTGIQISNIRSCTVDNNIVAYERTGPSNNKGAQISGVPRDVNVHDNIFYDWRNGGVLWGGAGTNINIENNYYWDEPASGSNQNIQDDNIQFVDPDRSAASYNVTQGFGASLEAFLDEVKKQRKGNWRQSYTAYAVNQYIRDGFQIVAGGNNPPVVQPITHNATDVRPGESGLQIDPGVTVTYSGSASDPNDDNLTWQWIYVINDGAEIIFSNGTTQANPIPSVEFTYPQTSAGSNYRWILRVTDGTFIRQSSLNVEVVSTGSDDPPDDPPGNDPPPGGSPPNEDPSGDDPTDDDSTINFPTDKFINALNAENNFSTYIPCDSHVDIYTQDGKLKERLSCSGNRAHLDAGNYVSGTYVLVRPNRDRTKVTVVR